MRPQLRAVVEDAYAVFGDYRIRHSLTVCHCNSCMSVEHEHELLKTRLRDIPARLLAEYTGSAHNWDDGPVAREMRYFLPRYFELIALNDPPDTGGIDICLRRLAQAGWRAKWPDRECDVIDRFFDELMRTSLERLELVRWLAFGVRSRRRADARRDRARRSRSCAEGMGCSRRSRRRRPHGGAAL